jgi:hypothetical protein
MAPPIYSERFVSESGAGTGIYGPTVPVGQVFIVRDVDLFEETAAGGVFAYLANQTGGVLWAFQAGTTIATRYAGWRGRQVFAEGELVQVHVVNGLWDIAVSGYMLSAP